MRCAWPFLPVLLLAIGGCGTSRDVSDVAIPPDAHVEASNADDPFHNPGCVLVACESSLSIAGFRLLTHDQMEDAVLKLCLDATCGEASLAGSTEADAATSGVFGVTLSFKELRAIVTVWKEAPQLYAAGVVMGPWNSTFAPPGRYVVVLKDGPSGIVYATLDQTIPPPPDAGPCNDPCGCSKCESAALNAGFSDAGTTHVPQPVAVPR